MTKLIVIIGITGQQGGSVANTFLSNPSWRIRGLSRNTASPASKALTARGVEMHQGNLHDPKSLTTCFKGANLVFSVTDFWKPYFDPENRSIAERRGISIGQLAYELEYEQGKNIVDAVAREVEGLDDVGFIASTLCSAREESGGKYMELWHFDGKADVFPRYLEEHYPELKKKTSYVHTGYFFTSWRFLPGPWFGKADDGSVQMQFPTAPDVVVPHLDPVKDMGNWVEAILKLSAGSTVMAASEWLTWPQWIALWGEINGVKTNYKQVTVENIE